MNISWGWVTSNSALLGKASSFGQPPETFLLLGKVLFPLTWHRIVCVHLCCYSNSIGRIQSKYLTSWNIPGRYYLMGNKNVSVQNKRVIAWFPWELTFATHPQNRVQLKQPNKQPNTMKHVLVIYRQMLSFLSKYEVPKISLTALCLQCNFYVQSGLPMCWITEISSHSLIQSNLNASPQSFSKNKTFFLAPGP